MPRMRHERLSLGLKKIIFKAMNNSDFIRDIIKLRGNFDIEVAGRSMSPSLITGDRVRLIAPRNIDVGCLIAFPGRRSGWPVLHRLININQEQLLAIGDNGCVVTSLCPESLIGVVESIWNPETQTWAPIMKNDEAAAIAQLSAEVAEETNTTLDYNTENTPLELLLLHRTRVCAKWRESVLH